jgi:hypothetical protein
MQLFAEEFNSGDKLLNDLNYDHRVNLFVLNYFTTQKCISVNSIT